MPRKVHQLYPSNRARARQRNIGCHPYRRWQAVSVATTAFFAASATASPGSSTSHSQILIVIAPLHQIDMDMAVVVGIGAVAEYSRKTCARAVPKPLAQ